MPMHSPLRLLPLLLCLGLIAFTPRAAFADGNTPQTLPRAVAELEKRSGGRLGIAAFDSGSGAFFGYRETERFPFCSTFKALLVAAILRQSAQDEALLERRIAYTRKDLVSWSPITEKKAGKGMSVRELCAASLQYSDNTATNLLLQVLGGPDVLIAFARSLGDVDFTLSDFEPVLNSATPGDTRNTTTPAAMARSLHKTALGNALPEKERGMLQEWLKGNTTGDESIRAGVPKSWVVGDKTGGGYYGTTNDIAILWPPDREALVFALYFTQARKKAPPRKDVLAEAAKLLTTLPWTEAGNDAPKTVRLQK